MTVPAHAGSTTVAYRTPTARERGARGVLLELGLVAVALAVNLLVRWYTRDDLPAALDHAHDLLRLQEVLHLDWEHAVQDAALTVPGLAAAASGFYVWGYLPVLLAAFAGTYVWRQSSYLVLRDALLASGVVGVAVYAFYPVAPPRFTDLGYVDTVAGTAVDAAARPVGIANELAALPSFHIGWLIVVAVVLWRATRLAWVRALCVLHPAAMSYVVVATGNHWVLDVPAGAAIAVVGIVVADRLDARRRGSPGRTRALSGRRAGPASGR